MRKEISPVILFIILCIAVTLIIQSCKQNSPVQPNTNNNQGLNPPVLVSPQNQVSVQTATPSLDWNSYPSAASYRIQVSLDANFAGTMLFDTSGVTATHLVIPPNKLGVGVYNYWRIIASVPGGLSPWSATWRFNIIFNAPAPPDLLLPANNSTGQSFIPLFDWTDINTAQYYRIQVSNFSNFSPVIIDSNMITISQLQCPAFILNTNTQYYWRVNASNSNGVSTSPWSNIWNFTTINGPQPNTVSGRITFADTNFAVFPSYYTASIYSTSNWPPTGGGLPAGTDSLFIQRTGNVYTADYRISRIFNGNYYVCVTENNSAHLVGLGLVEGIYGCDTAHVPYSNCPNNPNPVIITNNNGLQNINFISWADTSKRIF